MKEKNIFKWIFLYLKYKLFLYFKILIKSLKSIHFGKTNILNKKKNFYFILQKIKNLKSPRNNNNNGIKTITLTSAWIFYKAL